MKAYQYPTLEAPTAAADVASGIETLQLVDVPLPAPGPRQVLMRVHAVSLNYKDLFVASGMPPRAAKTSLIPLSDAAGEVVGTGTEVTRFKKGERVMGIVAPLWISGPLTDAIGRVVLGTSVNGVLSEFIVLDESALVAIPSHLSFEEGATLPCAAATAWNALTGFCPAAKAGDTILVQGSGGVSLFALQFARMLGANVIAISSSDEKLRRLKEYGASEGFNYHKQPDWDQEVLHATSGKGVDQVVEVGGAGTLEKSFRAVRIGGTISLIGVLSGFKGAVDPLPVLVKNIRLQGVSVGPRKMFEDMTTAITKHSLRPVIDRIFPFREAREALHYLASGKQFGKIVIQV